MKKSKIKYFLMCLFFLLIFLNEFTLIHFDKNPPLSDQSLKYLRSFNFILISTLLLPLVITYFKKIKYFLNVLVIYIVIFIILDFTFSWLGYGYYKHYEIESLQRYPSPYDMFSGKPNTLDHNALGFRGKFNKYDKLENDAYAVAFFGGSTGYLGYPPIIEIIKKQFKKNDIELFIYNFSSISSNHTQHLHRLLKYIEKFKFDFVIFYGGANETLLPTMYDPRPGFPYNYFYRDELPTIKKFFIENSAIIGEIEKRYGTIVGLNKIRKQYSNNPKWIDHITDKYNEDLILANKLSTKIGIPHRCSKTNFISVRQPFQKKSNTDKKIYSNLDEISVKLNQDKNHNHIDLSKVNFITFTDHIHIDQASKVIISKKIKNFLFELLSNC